jgi:hypothetical protein
MINILPTNDIDFHEENSNCKCLPRILLEYGELIVIHNSFDNRELIEEVNKILGNTEN